MATPDVTGVFQGWEQLKTGRGVRDTSWQEAGELVWPEHSDITRRTQVEGEKRTERVYDATAALDLEKFAAVWESWATPRNSEWHHLRARDRDLNEDSAVRQWLDDLEELLFQIRASTTFYADVHQIYKSLGAFGNGCLYLEDHPATAITYRHCHVGNVWIAPDHTGRVDTVYHRYRLSARAAEQRLRTSQFGMPPSVVRALERSPHELMDFLHVVAPNTDRDFARLDADGKKWVSLDLCVADKCLIDQGGYDEMPYMYPRYSVNPNEIYGRGPAELVLPDIKTLQEMAKVLLRSAHKLVDPPLLLRHDGVIGVGARVPRLRPGGLNFGGLDEVGREMIKPLTSGAQPAITLELMERVRQSIHSAFLVDLFQILIERPQRMTAYEVATRAKEKADLVAPMIGRLQAELFGPLVEREVAIVVRNGWIRPPPEQFIRAGGRFEIDYESELIRSQRLDEVLGIQRAFEIMAPLLAAQPSLIENLQLDDAFRASLKLSGVPERLLRPLDELAAIRAEQADAAREAEDVERAPDLAKAGAHVMQMLRQGGQAA